MRLVTVCLEYAMPAGCLFTFRQNWGYSDRVRCLYSRRGEFAQHLAAFWTKHPGEELDDFFNVVTAALVLGPLGRRLCVKRGLELQDDSINQGFYVSRL